MVDATVNFKRLLARHRVTIKTIHNATGIPMAVLTAWRDQEIPKLPVGGMTVLRAYMERKLLLFHNEAYLDDNRTTKVYCLRSSRTVTEAVCHRQYVEANAFDHASNHRCFGCLVGRRRREELAAQATHLTLEAVLEYFASEDAVDHQIYLW